MAAPGADLVTCMPTAATTTTNTAVYSGPEASPRSWPAAAPATAPGWGKLRWPVERGFAWLHAFKRLRTRYERRADIHQALLSLACSVICLRKLILN